MGHLDVLAQGVLEKRAGEKGLAWRVEANYREPGMLVSIRLVNKPYTILQSESSHNQP